MSTTYFLPPDPTTQLMVIDSGSHLRLLVWLDHKLAGELRGGKDDGTIEHFCSALCDRDVVQISSAGQRPEGDDRPNPWSVYWHQDVTNWRDDTTLISEYGDVLTLRELKAEIEAHVP